jgi:hypothetical protein
MASTQAAMLSYHFPEGEPSGKSAASVPGLFPIIIGAGLLGQ